MSTRKILSRAALAAGLALAFVLLAGNSLDPFQSPFRLRVSEPSEGAGVPEGRVRVVAELEARSQDAPPKNATPPPRPQVEVFLDKESKGTLKEGQNTLTIEGVAAGAHTLLVTASDPGGMVLDRKEIHFTALPPSPE